MAHSIDSTDYAFTWVADGPVAVLKLGPKAFGLRTHIDLKERFLALLSIIEQSPDVKALLLISPADYDGCSAYKVFLRQVSGFDVGQEADWHLSLAREENALKQLAVKISSFSKLTVAAFQGDITTSFFGTCLACDFRFADPKAKIVFPDTDAAVPPVGALGFYLPRYVGQGEATALLFSGEPISAKKAWNLGMVNELVPADTFERRVLERTKAICRQSTMTIKGTRKLIHTEVAELEKYMEQSHEIMTRWARSKGKGGQ